VFPLPWLAPPDGRAPSLRKSYLRLRRRGHACRNGSYSTVGNDEKKLAIAKVIELAGVRKALGSGASPQGGAQGGMHGPKQAPDMKKAARD
jgi:hypothetical protein